uniref:Uncharacterized protein n=1 Tax=uncultured marine group III euryarchaeote AD1000-40-D7 TaxID=526640 RepID=B3V626_9ARCH|nr:hypothetical protein [uncultured marine group III euryarchaeote AD1000-40-D7]
MDTNRSLVDVYSIPIAILFLLITTGGFTGNNGLSGDFGLDYCHDKDNITVNPVIMMDYDETERTVLHPNSFFACELGYVNGVVDLGWNIYTDDIGTPSEIEPWWQVMILNHDNYKKFVNGETYGFSNFYLSDLQSSVGAGETSEYKVGITLHSDTYFFVVDSGYEAQSRGLIGPNSPTGTSAGSPLYFYYMVDLDYDTSGVKTTN